MSRLERDEPAMPRPKKTRTSVYGARVLLDTMDAARAMTRNAEKTSSKDDIGLLTRECLEGRKLVSRQVLEHQKRNTNGANCEPVDFI